MIAEVLRSEGFIEMVGFEPASERVKEWWMMIRYDSVCLTCSKKLTGSQLSLPHGTNKRLECETKNKMMSIVGPVQSRYRKAVQ